MARYGVKTNKEPKDVLQQAVDFFGEDGIGLEVVERSPYFVSFQGGGGHVTVSMDQNAGTDVEVVTREFDYDVRQFIRKIA
jgi:hypothetical protein